MEIARRIGVDVGKQRNDGNPPTVLIQFTQRKNGTAGKRTKLSGNFFNKNSTQTTVLSKI